MQSPFMFAYHYLRNLALYTILARNPKLLRENRKKPPQGGGFINWSLRYFRPLICAQAVQGR
jgi:hypothetical protein